MRMGFSLQESFSGAEVLLDESSVESLSVFWENRTMSNHVSNHTCADQLIWHSADVRSNEITWCVKYLGYWVSIGKGPVCSWAVILSNSGPGQGCSLVNLWCCFGRGTWEYKRLQRQLERPQSSEWRGYLCEQGRMLRSEAKGRSPVLQQVFLA